MVTHGVYKIVSPNEYFGDAKSFILATKYTHSELDDENCLTLHASDIASLETGVTERFQTRFDKPKHLVIKFKRRMISGQYEAGKSHWFFNLSDVEKMVISV